MALIQVLTYVREGVFVFFDFESLDARELAFGFFYAFCRNIRS